MNDPTPDRPDKIDDILRLYRLVKATPGLPMPNVGPARFALRYTDIKDRGTVMVAVGHALAVLGDEFGITRFVQRDETAGDGTPLRLFEAILLSGLILVVVATREHVDGLDQGDDAGVKALEFGGVAA
jgi:hypothetical protein